jgi:hypothetical protein
MVWRRACITVVVLAVAACTRSGESTANALRDEIAAYERADPAASEDRIAALFAKLDAEIAARRADELEKPPAERPPVTAEREALAATRRDLQAEYLKARIKRLGVAADEALRGMADQLGRGLEDAGRALRDAMPAGPKQ